jgi:hypothetical protein
MKKGIGLLAVVTVLIVVGCCQKRRAYELAACQCLAPQILTQATVFCHTASSAQIHSPKTHLATFAFCQRGTACSLTATAIQSTAAPGMG